MSEKTGHGDKRSRYYSSSSSYTSSDESDDQSNNKDQLRSLSRKKSLSPYREASEEKREGSKTRDDKYSTRESSSKDRDKLNYESELRSKYTESRRDKYGDREKRHRSRSRERDRRRRKSRSRSRSRSYRSHSRRKSRSRSRSHRSRSRSRSHSYTGHSYRSHRHYRHRSRRRSRSRSYERSKPHGRHFDKGANKLSVLEKLGIELKIPEGIDKTQLTEGKAPSDISFPSYYNPSNVNPLKYMQQMQKRKLIWGNKAKQEGQNSEKKEEESNTKASGDLTNVWQTAKFSQDQDGKLTAKFKRLMGIKDSDTTTVNTGETNSELIKKQEEMFSSMEKQYEVARVATHTHRGVGLGFGVHQYPR